MGAKNGSILAPPGTPLETPPGTPRPGPRVHKKCTFFWVFNNSPSRDSLVGFFGQFGTVWEPPSLGQSGTVWAYPRENWQLPRISVYRTPRDGYGLQPTRSVRYGCPECWGGRLASGPYRRPYGDWGERGVRRNSSLKAKTEVCAG